MKQHTSKHIGIDPLMTMLCSLNIRMRRSPTTTFGCTPHLSTEALERSFMHLLWRLVFCTVVLFTHVVSKQALLGHSRSAGGFCLCEPHTAIRGCAVANAGRCSPTRLSNCRTGQLGDSNCRSILTMCGALICRTNYLKW